MDPHWPTQSTAHLLAAYRAMMRELRERGVTRTGNAPTGDYAEYLVNKLVRGELAPNSEKSFDVTGADGVRYQVKSRVVDGGIGQRQMSPFRSWDFDLAAIVLFDDDYGIHVAALVPLDVIRERARFIAHVNGYIAQANAEVLGHPDTIDVTTRLREIAGDSHVDRESRPQAQAEVSPQVSPPAAKVRSRGPQMRFHGKVAERVGVHLGTALRKRKGTSFESADGTTLVICLSSKRHDHHVEKYWYGLTPVQVETLKTADTAYLAFGCGSEELVFTVPWTDFSTWTDGLNRTENDRGGYWHVFIEWSGDGFALRRKDGFEWIDMEPYRVRR
jgi:hypothetical protein